MTPNSITALDATMARLFHAGRKRLAPMVTPIFEFRRRLDRVLPQDFRPGEYDISVSYHNQYGENCFKGWVASKTIKVMIHAADE